MDRPSDLAQLQQLALQTMPPGPYFCILCGNPPHYVGVGRVDGRAWGYHICTACLTPDYVARVVRHIRGELLRRRRN